jgi:hypothetical protein
VVGDAIKSGADAHNVAIACCGAVLVTPSEVRLIDVPVELFLESQNHQQDLIRELALIDIGERQHHHADAPLPVRVATLIGEIFDQYGDVRSVTRQQALQALAAGDEVVTLLVPVRPGLTEALQRWLHIVEEADRLCAEGVLLTLSATPEIQALRRWYVDAISEAVEVFIMNTDILKN